MSISSNGELTIGELFAPEVEFVVRASYAEDGVTVSSEHWIVAEISVSVEDLVRGESIPEDLIR